MCHLLSACLALPQLHEGDRLAAVLVVGMDAWRQVENSDIVVDYSGFTTSDGEEEGEGEGEGREGGGDGEQHVMLGCRSGFINRIRMNDVSIMAHDEMCVNICHSNAT
eukprot:jgi/Mesvir1/24734/Mv21998-RA.1